MQAGKRGRFGGSLLGAVLALGASAACGPGPAAPSAGPKFDEVTASKHRTLWVAAHPDDESIAGPLLARTCFREGTCHFLVFTHGRGGECCLPEGCKPDLGTLRHEELVKSARAFRATLEHYDLFNAPLPVESFPTMAELADKWRTQNNPVGLVARAIRRFKPDIVVTLDPYQGWTGHPEHKATARFAMAGARVAADAGAKDPMLAGEEPHRVKSVYHLQNKYWLAALAGLPNDPKPYSESLDATRTCDDTVEARSCVDIFVDASRNHASQACDMGALRGGRGYFGTTYVRQMDPFGAEATQLLSEIGEPKARADKGEQP